MSKDNKQKLLEFTHTCNKLRQKLLFGTTSLTPINLEEEKIKFFASPTHNPIFIYKKFDATKADTLLKNLKQQLKTLKIPYDLRIYLQDYLKDLKLLEKTKLAIGTDDFAFYAKKLFKINEYDIHKTLLSLPSINFDKHESKKLYNAYEIAGIFEDVLHDQYNLDHFTVRVDEHARHTIWTGNTTINIGSDILRYDHNVARLIVHEIESHALQRYNLSLYNNTIIKKAYNQYVYRSKAVSMLSLSFREIFNYLTQFISAGQAFLITYRVKRGMKHTAKPGGFPKDAFYLLGYKVILDYVKAGLRPEFLYISRNPYLSSLLLSQNLLLKTDLKLPTFWKKSYAPSSTPAFLQAPGKV